jgi:hypothetical protein
MAVATGIDHKTMTVMTDGLGRHDQRISPAAMAPTASRLLGIDSPGGCVEDPLNESLQIKNKF